MPLRKKLASSGFTLPELMVVIAIIAILAGIAIPSFRDFIVISRLAGEANDLMTDLAFTRAEAGRRGLRATICRSTSGTSCATGSGWEGGRIVYVDIDGDGAVDADEILRVTPSSADKDVAITAIKFSTLNSITFRPNGAASSSGCFEIKEASTSQYKRQVMLSTTGRTSLNSPAATGVVLCTP